MRRLLSLEPDFEVVGEAKNGTEVLDLVRELQPDILLLDLKMPGLDGLSALQRIQNQKLKTKIIVLTASDDEGEYLQANEVRHLWYRPQADCHRTADQGASGRSTVVRFGWIPR